jgi:hypothetical protein
MLDDCVHNKRRAKMLQSDYRSWISALYVRRPAFDGSLCKAAKVAMQTPIDKCIGQFPEGGYLYRLGKL